MVALAKTVLQIQAFSACCSALRILPRKSLAETNPMDGCIFPYETRGVPPFFVWLAMACLEACPWPTMLPLCHHCPPPFEGGFWFLNITASWSRLADEMMTTMSMKAHWRVDLRGLWERFYRGYSLQSDDDTFIWKRKEKFLWNKN